MIDEPRSAVLPRLAGPAQYWDAPVVDALDMVETLTGFSPDRIEWDNFRFWATGGGPMRVACIYAYPRAVPRAPLRFAVDSSRFTLSGRDRGQIRELSIGEASRYLDVPVESAAQATAALRSALARSLARYNHVHQPGRLSPRTHGAGRVPASYPPAIHSPVPPGRPDPIGL